MDWSDEVIEWLLEEDNPSVRFLTLTELLGKSVQSKEVKQTRKAIMAYGPAAEIIGAQNDDGSWGTPARFYNDKYTGSVWNLLLLAELRADPGEMRVQKACRFILNRSLEPESGGFSYTSSAKTGTGLPSGVIPCLTGNMVYALVRLGYLEEPGVQRAVEWITRFQRADDAVAESPRGVAYDRYEMCWGRHSCHMGVAKSLKGLAAIPAELRTKAIEHKIEELLEYFLAHHIYKKSHDLDQVARPGWLKLGFPLMYQTDILELLGIFSDLGRRDARLEEAVAIVQGKQGPDGKWKLENSFNGKMLVTIEKKGQPSKWITYKALKVLKALG